MEELGLYSVSFKLLLSLVVGILFGIERDMRHLLDKEKEPETVHFGGVRTFALIGLLGGLCGYMGLLMDHPIYIYGFIAVAFFVITSYIIEHKKDVEDLGMTTEFSALLAYTLGALSFVGRLEIVVAVTILVLFLLSQKKSIKQWGAKIRPAELLASLQFGLVLLVVFPFLRGVEPIYWNELKLLDPYQIWKMVILISAISYFGFFLTRMIGQEKGILVSGVLGGLASSTAVTHAMASQAAKVRHRELTQSLVSATLLANAISCFRAILIILVLNLSFLSFAWMPLGLMAFICLIPGLYLIWGLRSSRERVKTEVALESPFSLTISTRLRFHFPMW